MPRDANVIRQLLVAHAIGTANEARNQILLFGVPASGHDSFQGGVIVVITLDDSLP